MQEAPEAEGRVGASDGSAGFRVVGRRQNHDNAFLRRNEDVPVPEPVEHYAFQRASSGLDRGHPLSRSSEGDLVSACQVQPEGFGTLYQFTQMGIPAQQVLDQLATNRLLLADPRAP